MKFVDICIDVFMVYFVHYFCFFIELKYIVRLTRTIAIKEEIESSITSAIEGPLPGTKSDEIHLKQHRIHKLILQRQLVF